MRRHKWGVTLAIWSAIAFAGDPTQTQPQTMAEVEMDALTEQASATGGPQTNVLWNNFREAWVDGDIVEGQLSDTYLSEAPEEETAAKTTGATGVKGTEKKAQ